MQDYFYTLAAELDRTLHNGEVYWCQFSAEQSDFIRFNHAQVRQAGTVVQRYLTLNLVKNNRHSSHDFTLSGDLETDKTRLQTALTILRAQLPYLPEDPYLLYATEVHSTESLGNNNLPASKDLLPTILEAVHGFDFVGIYAAGGIFKGFANSLGQRNFHRTHTFNLDWSFYHTADKAVKTSLAGFDWNITTFQEKVAQAKTQLQILKRTPRTIQPGSYRVYLSPTALYEITSLINWGGFSLKAQRTKQSPLLRMMTEPPQQLHPTIHFRENAAQGLSPAFSAEGFIKPAHVALITAGVYQETLVSPRSAKEYGIATNGANEGEMAVALELGAGDFPQAKILNELDTGIYINNLWYLNYSDRAAARMTGMTRFATLWVERGEIVAPLNVMRFDETLYRILGNQLIALTQEREFIIESETYGGRSTGCAWLPGALVDEFTLTL